MPETVNTATYGTVVLSKHATADHLCWRTQDGKRVGPFHATLSAALAYGQYLSRR